MSETPIVPVVSIAFRNIVYGGKSENAFRKVGEPVLQIEVLGDCHNFEHIGELLFRHYLQEVLNEELYMHMWRFEPCDRGDNSLALDPSLPILSDEMRTTNPFSTFVEHKGGSKTSYKVKEGMDLLFKYDEGSPTYLMATIESINPLPEGKSVDAYPAKKADPNEHLIGKKRQRIEETPALTIPMDEAYPHLRARGVAGDRPRE